MARQRVGLKRTTLIGVGCATFLCSVGFVRIGLVEVLENAWPLVVVVCAVVYRRFTRKLIIMILVCGVIGIWRGEVFMSTSARYQSHIGHKTIITLTADEDAVYGRNGQLKFVGSDVMLGGEKLAGKVQISGFGVNAIYEGDRLIAEGKLRGGYGSSQASMSYAKMELLDRQPSTLTKIRQRFASGISTALPEPLASFAMGLLIGQRSTLPEEVKENLRHVGLMHIVAVSGYNLTIIVKASEKFFSKHSRNLSLGISVFLILIFLAITGGAASIVRASIVSMLSLLAGYYGRSFRPLNLILLAAAVTAFANPFYVWGDLGWYLSFLAFIGVMLLAPMLMKKLRPSKEWAIVPMIILETICAEIMTMPLILHFFGEMTLVGLPANVLVVTLIPLAMIFGVVAGVAGVFVASISGWLSWPAVIILNFMLDTTSLMASLPNTFIDKLEFSMVQMLVSYFTVAIFILILHSKTKIWIPAKITDKKNNL